MIFAVAFNTMDKLQFLIFISVRTANDLDFCPLIYSSESSKDLLLSNMADCYSVYTCMQTDP